MRFAMIVFLMGALGMTVSCAHKQKDQAQAEQKLEAKKIITVKAVDKDKKQEAFTCLVGKDQRTVTIDRKAKRCEVHYTKHGEKQQVAWAESTQDICTKAFSNIRGNIEKNGYKCQDGLKAIKKGEKTRETASAKDVQKK